MKLSGPLLHGPKYDLLGRRKDRVDRLSSVFCVLPTKRQEGRSPVAITNSFLILTFI